MSRVAPPTLDPQPPLRLRRTATCSPRVTELGAAVMPGKLRQPLSSMTGGGADPPSGRKWLIRWAACSGSSVAEETIKPLTWRRARKRK